MTAVATKPKKKNTGKTLSFRQLVGRCSADEEKWPLLLKTAVNFGWLTDGEFMTRLTDEECQECQQLYNKLKSAKQAKIEEIKVPHMVGPQVATVKMGDKKTRLISITGQLAVEVETSLYLTMRKRHKDSSIYFSPENPENSPVIFSEKTAVAMLMPLK